MRMSAPGRGLDEAAIRHADVSPKFIRLAERISINRPIICDIGSRDAREGIFLMQRLNAKQLHVFEPNPVAAAVCRENLARFSQSTGCEGVLFNELAVTDEVGTRMFYPINPVASGNKDIGFSSLYRLNPNYTRRRGSIVQEEIKVNTTTLDAYFAGKEFPDIIWMDVEGAELEVLRGSTSVLRDATLIHLEVSFRPMQIGKPLFWEIQKYLAAMDYVFCGLMEVSALKGFLYRYKLLPNLPWRLNAVFCKRYRHP